MRPAAPRTYRAGELFEDFYRACTNDRLHTVVVVDARGTRIRVVMGASGCRTRHAL